MLLSPKVRRQRRQRADTMIRNYLKIERAAVKRLKELGASPGVIEHEKRLKQFRSSWYCRFALWLRGDYEKLAWAKLYRERNGS